jgi:anti-sigma factor RsiW
MESNFEERDSDRQLTGDQSEREEQCSRFELLSAYLDGEVTAAERKQVQHWLDTDPQMQKLYRSLSRLHQDINSIPVTSDVPETVKLPEQVFERLDRDRRRKRVAFLGGAAIAAVVIGVVSNLFVGREIVPRFAHSPLAPIEDSEQLTIALNHPVINIPAEALSKTQKSIQK